LTEGRARLAEAPGIDDRAWAIAAGLGQASRHPLARALAETAVARGVLSAAIDSIAEHPGEGMSGTADGVPVRLGRREWIGGDGANGRRGTSEMWLRIGDASPQPFRFEDALRSDAPDTIVALRDAGLEVVLLSGDGQEAVATVAARAGIHEWRADQRPTDKAAYLADLASAGRRVLMVGDGLNDAPALAGAFVSMSPSSAADISQTAADAVFTGNKLAPVVLALRVARAARRLILQNFALAIGYNMIAVPIAVLGYATPLIAAVAMSASSILVTANAVRLRLVMRRRSPQRAPRTTRTQARVETPA
jgi:P-type Cu2+ transporter